MINIQENEDDSNKQLQYIKELMRQENEQELIKKTIEHDDNFLNSNFYKLKEDQISKYDKLPFSTFERQIKNSQTRDYVYKDYIEQQKNWPLQREKFHQMEDAQFFRNKMEHRTNFHWNPALFNQNKGLSTKDKDPSYFQQLNNYNNLYIQSTPHGDKQIVDDEFELKNVIRENIRQLGGISDTVTPMIQTLEKNEINNFKDKIKNSQNYVGNKHLQDFSINSNSGTFENYVYQNSQYFNQQQVFIPQNLEKPQPPQQEPQKPKIQKSYNDTFLSAYL